MSDFEHELIEGRTARDDGWGKTAPPVEFAEATRQWLGMIGCAPGCVWIAEYHLLFREMRYFHSRGAADPVPDSISPEEWLHIPDEMFRGADFVSRGGVVRGSVWIPHQIRQRAEADHRLWQSKDPVGDAVKGDFDEEFERSRLRPV